MVTRQLDFARGVIFGSDSDIATARIEDENGSCDFGRLGRHREDKGSAAILAAFESCQQKLCGAFWKVENSEVFGCSFAPRRDTTTRDSYFPR